MAPLWNTFGRLVEPFWLAFSAFERLEPQREPFQPQFYDCWMDVFSLSSSLSRGWLVRAFERSEAELGRCWLDVWMDVWMDCWMDVFSLFSEEKQKIQNPIVLSVFCMLRFWDNFGTPFWKLFEHRGLEFRVCSCLLPIYILLRFSSVNLDRRSSRNIDLVLEVLQKPSFRRSRNSDDFKVVFFYRRPWGQFFSLLLPWRHSRKLMNFQGGTGFIVRQVGRVIKDRLGTLKALNNLPADLQKATSGQMSAEKQPI